MSKLSFWRPSQATAPHFTSRARSAAVLAAELADLAIDEWHRRPGMAFGLRVQLSAALLPQALPPQPIPAELWRLAHWLHARGAVVLRLSHPDLAIPEHIAQVSRSLAQRDA